MNTSSGAFDLGGNKLLIDVRDLKKNSGEKKSYSFSESIDLYENGNSTPLIQVSAEIVNAGKSLIIKGTLNSKVELECCRCLEPLTYSLETSFQEEFLPRQSDGKNSKKMLPLEDLDVFFYDNDEIDLSDVCRQILLTALPLTPFCKESCRGLCGNCGENLNLTECSCNKK